MNCVICRLFSSLNQTPASDANGFSAAPIDQLVLRDLEYAIVGGSTGVSPYTSGLRYDVDASHSKGSHISHVKVNTCTAGSGHQQVRLWQL
jgi:hypothetical protein